MSTARRRRHRLAGTAFAVVGPAAGPSLPADPRHLSDDEVARRLFPLAARLAGRPGRQDADYDDVLSATWLRLWQGVRRWRPGGGASAAVSFAYPGGRDAWRRAGAGGVTVGPKRKPGAGLKRARLADREHAGDRESRNGGGGHVPVARDTTPAVHPDDLAHWERLAGRLPWQALTLTSMGGLSYRQAAADMRCSFARLEALVELARRRILHGRPVRRLTHARPYTPPAVTPALPGL